MITLWSRAVSRLMIHRQSQSQMAVYSRGCKSRARFASTFAPGVSNITKKHRRRTNKEWCRPHSKLWKLPNHLWARSAVNSHAISDLSYWFSPDVSDGILRLHSWSNLWLWLLSTPSGSWVYLHCHRHCTSKPESKVLAVSSHSRPYDWHWRRLSFDLECCHHFTMVHYKIALGQRTCSLR